MSTSIDSSVGKVAESGYRGARVQFKALHLDYINDHPESIVWVEEKGFAPDRDLEREPPAARIWLVKLPGLERTPGAGVSGEQMMVMKVFIPEEPVRCDYGILNGNLCCGPFDKEIDTAMTIIQDEEAREAGIMIKVHGWFELQAGHVGRKEDGTTFAISGKVILKDYEAPQMFYGQSFMNFNVIPPSQMREHRRILDRLGIYDQFLVFEKFQNGKYVELSTCLVIDHITSEDKDMLDTKYQMGDLYYQALEGLGQRCKYGLTFNAVPYSECEKAFDDFCRLERANVVHEEQRYEDVVSIVLNLWKKYNPGKDPDGPTMYGQPPYPGTALGLRPASIEPVPYSDIPYDSPYRAFVDSLPRFF